MERPGLYSKPWNVLTCSYVWNRSCTRVSFDEETTAHCSQESQCRFRLTSGYRHAVYDEAVAPPEAPSRLAPTVGVLRDTWSERSGAPLIATPRTAA